MGIDIILAADIIIDRKEEASNTIKEERREQMSKKKKGKRYRKKSLETSLELLPEILALATALINLYLSLKDNQ